MKQFFLQLVCRLPLQWLRTCQIFANLLLTSVKRSKCNTNYDQVHDNLVRSYHFWHRSKLFINTQSSTHAHQLGDWARAHRYFIACFKQFATVLCVWNMVPSKKNVFNMRHMNLCGNEQNACQRQTFRLTNTRWNNAQLVHSGVASYFWW